MILLSASQISTYRDECHRKWAFKSIAKIQADQHASAALGTEVDDTQLQPYLREGRAFDYARPSGSGYIAASGLAFLPAPMSSGLEVQKHFVLPSPFSDEVSYQGYIDLWMPKGGIPLPDPYVSDIPVVSDFKTTGNLKWQKSAKVLAKDVQAQLYATWAMYQTKAPVVDLVWIYMQTKGARKAKRTHLRVLQSDVAEQFRAIDKIGQEMVQARLEIESAARAPGDLERLILEHLPANPDACDGYGGCPFTGRCNLAPAEFVNASMAQAILEMESIPMSDTMTLLEKMKAKRAAAGAPKGIPVENLPPGIAPAPSTPPSTMGCAPEDVPAPTEIPAVFAGPSPEKPFAGINPPEKDLPVPGSQPAPVQSEAVSTGNGQAPAAEKPKRGRPAGSKNAKPAGALQAPIDDLENVGQIAADRGVAACELATGFETVTVTWAEERFSPIQFNSFGVGPFEATGFVRDGETVAQAMTRIYAELSAFAETERMRKAESFKTAIGGAK